MQHASDNAKSTLATRLRGQTCLEAQNIYLETFFENPEHNTALNRESIRKLIFETVLVKKDTES